MTVLIEGWLPPSRENWELLNWGWQFFPLFTAIQWFTDFYPAGKTSLASSKLNLPGKWAWLFMELPGISMVLFCMFNLPPTIGLEPRSLPIGNWTMAVIYAIHYSYRAILSPLVLNPSMSPIHLLVFCSAFSWQLINGLCIGGWLAGYGPTTVNDWTGRLYVVEVGLVIWGWGLLANMFHDDDLRQIRRDALKSQKEKAAKEKTGKIEGIDKVYMLPKNGLFKWILYPHYLCEWIEWAGFWMVGGLACTPARSFLFNEIAAMLPRALQGKQWYIDKFGADKVGKRKAIIPGLL